MIDIPIIDKLDIPISERLLEAISNVFEKYHDDRQVRNSSPKLEILRLQPEQSTKWLYQDDEDITIINDFVYNHFDSATGCRIHLWKGGTEIADIPHDHPRIFIPVTNDYCVYGCIDNTDKKHEMTFKRGNCYVWDVRYRHTVVMNESTIPRIVFIMVFDPKKETIYKGL